MRLFFSLFFLLVCSYAHSQFEIKGKVVNEQNQPIENVHIHVVNKTTATDKDGNYKFSNMSEGTYIFEFSHLSYQSFEEKVFLNADKILNVNLKLKYSQIEEVSVKSNNKIAQTEKETTITKNTIDRFSSQNLGDVLKEISGVSTLKTGNSIVKPVINGLHSNRVVTLNQGIRIEDQQWGIEHAPNIDINAIHKIKVIKGASALQYGSDAIGGFVVLENNKIKKDTLFGKTITSYNSNGKGGTISSSLYQAKQKGLNWNINGTFKYFGDRETKNYVLSNSGNREQNFSATLLYPLQKHEFALYYSLYNAQIGILKASHIGNTNDLYNAIVNLQPSIIEDFTYNISQPKQETTHHFIKFQDNISLSETSNLDLVYSFQFNNRKEFDVRRNSQNTNAALDLELKTHIFKADFLTNTGRFLFKNGVNALIQRNVANPFTGIRPLIPTYEKFEMGLYGITNFNINDSFLLELGARIDYSEIEASKYYLKSRWNERNYNYEFASFIQNEVNSQYFTKPKFKYINFASNIGFKKTFHHDYEWYLNISLASRNPNVSELFSDGLHHSNGQIELGDLRLIPEKSMKFSTTLVKSWKKVDLEINPYINYITDFIFLKPTGFETTIRGAFPVWEYQQTNAMFSGVDFSFNTNVLENLLYNFRLAYVNGWDKKNDKHLIDIPPFRLVNSLKFNQKEWYDFKIELKNELVLPQKEYPDYDYDASIILNNQLETVRVPVSKPPKGYSLIHFYSEVQINTSKKTNLVLAFSIDNLTNEVYRDYLNRQRFFIDEMGRNFQLQLKFNY